MLDLLLFNPFPSTSHHLFIQNLPLELALLSLNSRVKPCNSCSLLLMSLANWLAIPATNQRRLAYDSI